ncbi:sugar phosphate nucleotidyltransferase [Candidatus Eisenbacteria bacterium]|uniref:Sugar phosphate nucleotidyltransferase n=1 Tax=Eiseniibacteriota bacterium TaxID=2212470 RepID=A0ABV6YQI5_UNCEI
MKAVIPVAGEGTRLRPHTHTVPKPLLRVAGKPILGHILDDVVALGIREVVLVVGYRGENIVDYVRANYDLELSFVEQTERLGLGHAIHLSKEFVGDEPVLILLGDTIFKGDLKKMVASGGNSIGVKRVPDPERFGIAEIEGSRIVSLVEKPEKPRSDLAVAGIYSITDSAVLYGALDSLISSGRRTKGEFQLTDALNMMIEKGSELKCFEVEGWYDCGKPETLLETNRALLELACPRVEIPGSILIDPVCIGENVVIESSVIGPFVSVAENAIIKRSIIRNSIVGESAVVEDGLLDSSLIGDRAVVKGTFKRLNVGDSSEIDFT